MRKIKFSHMYNKLNGIDCSKPVKLIDCESRGLGSLTDEFLEYDTSYVDDGVEKNYPLVSGHYLLLFFVDSKGSLFTTIRRETPSKYDYYMGSVGCSFDLIMEGKGKVFVNE